MVLFELKNASGVPYAGVRKIWPSRIPGCAEVLFEWGNDRDNPRGTPIQFETLDRSCKNWRQFLDKKGRDIHGEAEGR